MAPTFKENQADVDVNYKREKGCKPAHLEIHTSSTFSETYVTSAQVPGPVHVTRSECEYAFHASLCWKEKPRPGSREAPANTPRDATRRSTGICAEPEQGRKEILHFWCLSKLASISFLLYGQCVNKRWPYVRKGLGSPLHPASFCVNELKADAVHFLCCSPSRYFCPYPDYAKIPVRPGQS